MGEADQHGAMRVIAGLQALRVDAARGELKVADEALNVAADHTRDARLRRNDALQDWYNALEGSRPDPAHMQYAGDWLVDREAQLELAEADQGMAQARRDQTALALAETTALREVALELTAGLRRRNARAQAERHLQTADDLHRTRRLTCTPR